MIDGPPAAKRKLPGFLKVRANSVTSCPGALPDLHQILGVEIEFLAWLHTERGIPGVEVPYGIATIFVRRVAIGRDALAQGLFPDFVAPALRKCEEESLIPCKAL